MSSTVEEEIGKLFPFFYFNRFYVEFTDVCSAWTMETEMSKNEILIAFCNAFLMKKLAFMT